MELEFSYKLKVFGDFFQINPKPEVMLSIINDLRDMELIPSSAQEADTRFPFGAKPPIPRILLIDETNTLQVFIGVNTIEFNVLTKVENGLSKSDINKTITDGSNVIARLLNKYSKASNRLALNSEYFILEPTPEEKTMLLDKFRCNIPGYSADNLFEFANRLVARTIIKIGDNDEIVNKVIIFETFSGIMTILHKSFSAEGYKITFDINTLGDNENVRFSQVEDLSTFFNKAEEIRKDILFSLRA